MAFPVLLWYFGLMYLCQLSHQNYSPIGLLLDEEFQWNQPWSTQALMHNAIQLAVRNLAQGYPNLRVHWSSSSRLSTRSGLKHLIQSNTKLILLTTCANANIITQYINGSLMRPVLRTLRLDTHFCPRAFIIPNLTQQVTLYNLPDNQVAMVLTASLASFTETKLPFDEQGHGLDTNYAFWQQETHPTIHNWSPTSSKSVRRYLKDRTLRLSTTKRVPFVRYSQANNVTVQNGNVSYQGVCFEIIYALQSKFSFNYTVTPPEDKSFGKLLPDGTWNGMIRMVIDQAADMGAAPFTMGYTRKTAVDFSTSFHEETTTILIPPPREDSKTFACTKPFRPQVWLLLILVLFILPPVLWFHHRVLWTVNKRYGITTMTQEFSFVFGVLNTQSGQELTPGLAPRLLGAIWCLSAVVIVYLYMGTLMSFLTVIKLRPIINSLEELVTSGELKYTVLKASALDGLLMVSRYGLLMEAKDGVYTTIGTQIQQNPAVHYITDDMVGFRNILTGQYAYLKEKSWLDIAMDEDFAETQRCRFSLAKQEFFQASFGFIFPKKSFLSIFDTDIMRMVEAGLPGFWIKRQRNFNPCSTSSLVIQGEGVKSLSLDDLQSAFVIFGAGVAASLLLYSLEWIYFKYQKSTKVVFLLS